MARVLLVSTLFMVGLLWVVALSGCRDCLQVGWRGHPPLESCGYVECCDSNAACHIHRENSDFFGTISWAECVVENRASRSGQSGGITEP